jgi:putative PIN family toxin of toxin-antitoxin system
MTPLSRVRVFLDSSILVAATLSSTGGSFRLCRESRAGNLTTYINQYVQMEVREVISRKYFTNLNKLDLLFEWSKINIVSNPKPSRVKKISNLINLEDAPILAGALDNKADFLITLDRKDFLTPKLKKFSLPTIIVTPQEFFQQYWK